MVCLFFPLFFLGSHYLRVVSYFFCVCRLAPSSCNCWRGNDGSKPNWEGEKYYLFWSFCPLERTFSPNWRRKRSQRKGSPPFFSPTLSLLKEKKKEGSKKKKWTNRSNMQSTQISQDHSECMVCHWNLVLLLWGPHCPRLGEEWEMMNWVISLKSPVVCLFMPVDLLVETKPVKVLCKWHLLLWNWGATKQKQLFLLKTSTLFFSFFWHPRCVVWHTKWVPILDGTFQKERIKLHFGFEKGIYSHEFKKLFLGFEKEIQINFFITKQANFRIAWVLLYNETGLVGPKKPCFLEKKNN